MANEQKFPSEEIDLPSGGKLYPKDSPLSSGKITIKYMTAREEDILTSQNLIKKGIVLDQLMNSVILTEGVNVDDLLIGDKNAIMIAIRILAYGPEYTVEMTNPDDGQRFTHTFDLADLPYRKIPSDVKLDTNNFKFKLPLSKHEVVFKLLNGRDEKAIASELESLAKLNTSKDITTRLKYSIISIDGKDDTAFVNAYVENILARDSLALRNEMVRVSPDIEMVQEIDIDGERREVSIPLDINFFWPSE
tara:strand:+ start:114 stop:860 length:747 start_codon:yes stop_codon:yes gene_type:complete